MASSVNCLHRSYIDFPSTLHPPHLDLTSTSPSPHIDFLETNKLIKWEHSPPGVRQGRASPGALPLKGLTSRVGSLINLLGSTGPSGLIGP
jgi:hypothetical protein